MLSFVCIKCGAISGVDVETLLLQNGPLMVRCAHCETRLEMQITFKEYGQDGIVDLEGKKIV